MNDQNKTEETLPVLKQAANIAAASSVKPVYLIPQNLEQFWQLSVILSKSKMVPKDYINNREGCFVAMQMGAEVGLAPMQAIQNIAVINGRPSLWGDAQLGLVRQSGLMEYIREEYEGKGDNLTAVCEVKRKDEVVPSREVFSVSDAKTAGLWGKAGPWSNYPRRMLKYRARGYALRDAFPDVLKGLNYSREEVLDMESDDGATYQPTITKVNDAIHKANQALPETPSSNDVKKQEPEPKEVEKAPPPAVGSHEPNPWDPKQYSSMRSGNGKTTGFAAYVKNHADTFASQSDEFKSAAKEKWARVYSDKPFPLDSDKVNIFGTGPVSSFYIECPDAEVDAKCDDIYDNPEKYQLTKEYLKYIKVEFVDGSEFGLWEMASNGELESEQTQQNTGEPESVGMYTIFGVELAGGFEKVCHPMSIQKTCQHIWDKPSQYCEGVKDGSEEAYLRFLKYLHVRTPNGTEHRLRDQIEKEQTSNSSDGQTSIDPNGLYECPNAGNAEVNGQSCIDCDHLDGCPTHS